ncbi:MAG: hypothetical protein QW273_02030 [Candidatus Pacearchaeota archaeon]
MEENYKEGESNKNIIRYVSYSDVINNKENAKKLAKTAREVGKRLYFYFLNKRRSPAKDPLMFHVEDVDRVYREIGDIVFILKNIGDHIKNKEENQIGKGINNQKEIIKVNLTSEELKKSYHYHELPKEAVKSFRLDSTQKYYTIDAKELSTGGRGIYRYVFDSRNHLIGIAKHTKSAGNMNYEWFR